MNPTVYLAGPITGLSFSGAVDWRSAAIERLSLSGIQGISPMRAKDYLRAEGTLKMEYESSPLSSARGITTRDRWDCSRCSALLVNLVGAERISTGTVMEIAWGDSHRKPIVLVMEQGNIHDHPMIRESVGFIVSDLTEGLSIIEALLV